VTPVIDIDDRRFEEIGGERRIDHEKQALRLGRQKCVAPAERQCDDDQQQEAQSADPSAVQKCGQIGIVGFLVVMEAREGLTANTERVVQDQVEGLDLPAEAAFGSFVIGLGQRRALLQ